jgi:hypothetical protein
MDSQPPLDLHGIEQRAYRSQFDGGLVDLLLGSSLLAFAVCFLAGAGGLGGVWGAVLVPLWVPLHRSLADGRTGYAEFGPGRRAKVRRKNFVLALALGLSVLGAVALFIYKSMGKPEFGDTLRPLGPLPLAVALTAMIVMGSAMLELKRGYAYAGVVLGLCVFGHVSLDNMWIGLLAAAGVVIVSGVVVLMRFLRDHPRVQFHASSPDA